MLGKIALIGPSVSVLASESKSEDLGPTVVDAIAERLAGMDQPLGKSTLMLHDVALRRRFAMDDILRKVRREGALGPRDSASAIEDEADKLRECAVRTLSSSVSAVGDCLLETVAKSVSRGLHETQEVTQEKNARSPTEIVIGELSAGSDPTRWLTRPQYSREQLDPDGVGVSLNTCKYYGIDDDGAVHGFDNTRIWDDFVAQASLSSWDAVAGSMERRWSTMLSQGDGQSNQEMRAHCQDCAQEGYDVLCARDTVCLCEEDNPKHGNFSSQSGRTCGGLFGNHIAFRDHLLGLNLFVKAKPSSVVALAIVDAFHPGYNLHTREWSIVKHDANKKVFVMNLLAKALKDGEKRGYLSGRVAFPPEAEGEDDMFLAAAVMGRTEWTAEMFREYLKEQERIVTAINIQHLVVKVLVDEQYLINWEKMRANGIEHGEVYVVAPDAGVGRDIVRSEATPYYITDVRYKSSGKQTSFDQAYFLPSGPLPADTDYQDLNPTLEYRIAHQWFCWYSPAGEVEAITPREGVWRVCHGENEADPVSQHSSSSSSCSEAAPEINDQERSRNGDRANNFLGTRYKSR